MSIKVKVYEPLHYAIEQKAFFMWCDQDKPDGEEIVDFGLGEKKLSEYHWLVAQILVTMEADAAMRAMGPVTTKTDSGYLYCPYLPIMRTPVVPDPESFSPQTRKDLLKKLKTCWSDEAWIDLEECTSGTDTPLTRPDKLLSIDEDSCEEITMESRISHIKPTTAPDYIELKLDNED